MHHNPIAFHDPDGTTAYQYHDQYRPQRSWRRQFWNNTKQIVNSFSRGFIDDTSWGTSEYLFGEHQSTNWTQKVGYGAGTVASLGAGLLYGSTEAKIAAYGYKGLKLTSKQLLNHGSKLCTRNFKHFKRVTVMNSTGTVAKATKHAEKYFIKKNTTCKLLTKGGFAQTPRRGVGKQLDLDALSRAGQVVDRGGLTKAGRALDKHGNRLGSPFPKATGNSRARNVQGQWHVDDILTNPSGIIERSNRPRYGGNVIDIKIPGNRGLRYTKKGEFIGFLNP